MFHEVEELLSSLDATDRPGFVESVPPFLIVHMEEGFAATAALESYNWFLWKNQVRHHPKCGHPKYRSAP